MSDAEAYLNNGVTREDLGKLKKKELLVLAEYLKLGYTAVLKKDQIIEGIAEKVIVYDVENPLSGNVSFEEGEDRKSQVEATSSFAQGDSLGLPGVSSDVSTLQLQIRLVELQIASREKDRALEREKIALEKEERAKEREHEQRAKTI